MCIKNEKKPDQLIFQLYKFLLYLQAIDIKQMKGENKRNIYYNLKKKSAYA